MKISIFGRQTVDVRRKQFACVYPTFLRSILSPHFQSFRKVYNFCFFQIQYFSFLVVRQVLEIRGICRFLDSSWQYAHCGHFTKLENNFLTFFRTALESILFFQSSTSNRFVKKAEYHSYLETLSSTLYIMHVLGKLFIIRCSFWSIFGRLPNVIYQCKHGNVSVILLYFYEILV